MNMLIMLLSPQLPFDKLSRRPARAWSGRLVRQIGPAAWSELMATMRERWKRIKMKSTATPPSPVNGT
jgi:hypothetical protein